MNATSTYKDIINSNKNVIIVEEGLGSYNGYGSDPIFHPKGRLGAKLSAYKNGKLVYTSDRVSTLPDSLRDSYAYKFNGGSPIPTVCEGVYDLYTKYHLGKTDSKHRAFELGYGAETVPVVRNKVMSTSNAINLHYRNSISDSSAFAWSTGCITMYYDDLKELFSTYGITNFYGKYFGKLVIDRSNVDEEIRSIFEESYGDNMNKIASVSKAEEINIYDILENEDWVELVDVTKRMYAGSKSSEVGVFYLMPYLEEAIKKAYLKGFSDCGL